MRDYPFLVVAALIGVGVIGGLAAGGILRLIARGARTRERRAQRRRDEDDEDPPP